MSKELGRWTYKLGSVAEGCVVYDEHPTKAGGLKLQSHHDTDPARGQNNAFDLVRLHKFGALDKDIAADTPITERPSFKAMVEFALKQPRVQEEMRVDYGVVPLDDEEVAPRADAPVLQNVSEPSAVATPSSPKQRFHFIPAHEFAGLRPLQWIIKGLIPRAELMVVYGESGSGKSFLALDLAAAIARGESWQELKVKKGRVAYICAEGAGGFRGRLTAYQRKHAIELHDFEILPAAPNIAAVDEVNDLLKSLAAIKPLDLVVVDTLSAVTPGLDENSKDMQLALEHCKAIHKTTGALVMLIHHSGKDRARGSRGWSGIKAAADAEIEILRTAEESDCLRIAKLTKMKDGEDNRQWGFVLKPIILGVDEEDGKEITSLIVEAAELPTERPATTRVKLGKYGAAAYEVMRLIAVQPVYQEDAITAIAAKLIRDPTKRDRRQRDAARGLEELVTKKLAFVHANDMVCMSPAELAEEQDEA